MIVYESKLPPSEAFLVCKVIQGSGVDAVHPHELVDGVMVMVPDVDDEPT